MHTDCPCALCGSALLQVATLAATALTLFPNSVRALLVDQEVHPVVADLALSIDADTWAKHCKMLGADLASHTVKTARKMGAPV